MTQFKIVTGYVQAWSIKFNSKFVMHQIIVLFNQDQGGGIHCLLVKWWALLDSVYSDGRLELDFLEAHQVKVKGKHTMQTERKKKGRAPRLRHSFLQPASCRGTCSWVCAVSPVECVHSSRTNILPHLHEQWGRETTPVTVNSGSLFIPASIFYTNKVLVIL